MAQDSNCSWFYGFKQVIERKVYLSNFHIKLSLRNVLAKFRLGVSQIHCHRYKFSLVDDYRICPFRVKHYYEHEHRVLFVCQFYTTIRNEYLSNIISKVDNIVNDRFQFQTFIQEYQYVIDKYLLKMFVIKNDIVKNRMSDNLFV